METSTENMELIIQQRFDAFISFIQRQVEHMGADWEDKGTDYQEI